MSTIDEVAVVNSFNEAINARDLDRLGALMTDSHRFVDSAGATIDGRVACLDAWRGFFAAFPDYRNVFEECRGTCEGLVFVRGRSVCSVPALAGTGGVARCRSGRVRRPMGGLRPGVVRDRIGISPI
jgi:ketosteroid isomerase-like protein